MNSTSHSHVCEVCGARTPTLRRGRCWICYIRWADGRPVGVGASCAICQERRRDNLRMVEFQGTWVAMCHNCAAKTLRLMPVPRTVEGVRQRLSRDRRWRERRFDRKDHRIFAIDRRVGARRACLRPEELEWIDAEDLIVEIVDDEEAAGEATRIATSSSDQPSASDKR